MYTLYYSPGACSMAVHVLLNELGVPFDTRRIDLSKAENKSPEFLAVNPRGSVPVLEDDGMVIREGAAILLYLCEKHGSPLMPSSGPARAAALEWLMFANAALHPVYSRGFGLLKNSELDAGTKDQLMKSVVSQINTLWKEADETLAKRPHISGESLTVADILLTVIANWNGAFPGVTLGAEVKRLLKEVSSRPAYRKALQTENVEYKAAA